VYNKEHINKHWSQESERKEGKKNRGREGWKKEAGEQRITNMWVSCILPENHSVLTMSNLSGSAISYIQISPF
jgi:hypothetical protein